MKNYIYIFVAFVIVSCTKVEDKRAKDRIELSYKYEEETCEEQKDGVCLNIDIKYEILTQTPALKDSMLIMNENLLSSLFFTKLTVGKDSVHVDKLRETLIKEYRSLRANDPDIVLPWTIHYGSKIRFKNEKFISIETSSFSYTGGAHGVPSTRFVNMDLNGEKLTVEQLITDRGQFIKYVEAKFRKDNSIGEDGSFNDAGFWFENENFKLARNYGFNEKGMVFIYNPYEIAPYAKGFITMLIPFSELKSNGFLSKDFF